MEEPAALEVGLGDLLRRRVARHAQQLVVREPVDAPVGVLDELRVSGRTVGGLGRDLDVQPVESAAAAHRTRRALLLPLDDPAGDQRVQDLAGREPRGAGDLQQGIDVQDAVDPRKEIGLLRRQRQVLVTRHGLGRQDGDPVAVTHALAEGVGLGQAADALDDDGRRRQRQRHVGVQDSAGSLEAVLAGVPREGREDDLLDQAAHLRVEDRARDEAAVDQDLAEARPALFRDRVQSPVEVGVGDPAPAFEKGADPLALSRRRRGAELPLLEKQVAGLVAMDQRQRPLQAFEEDPAENLRQRRLGKRAPKPDGCGWIRHARLSGRFPQG